MIPCRSSVAGISSNYGQEQKENLQRKRDIVEKIENLAGAEDMEEALTQVKAMQQEFSEIGFVPIKFKNKVWDEYRAACDLFFKNLRSSGKGASSGSYGGGRSSGGRIRARKAPNNSE